MNFEAKASSIPQINEISYVIIASGPIRELIIDLPVCRFTAFFQKTDKIKIKRSKTNTRSKKDVG